VRQVEGAGAHVAEGSAAAGEAGRPARCVRVVHSGLITCCPLSAGWARQLLHRDSADTTPCRMAGVTLHCIPRGTGRRILQLVLSNLPLFSCSSVRSFRLFDFPSIGGHWNWFCRMALLPFGSHQATWGMSWVCWNLGSLKVRSATHAPFVPSGQACVFMRVSIKWPALSAQVGPGEREFFIDNLLVRIRY